MNPDVVSLSNDLWQAEVSPARNGRVTRLIDRATARVRVEPPVAGADQVAEGGHEPFFGLECWPKQGRVIDANTGVIAPFAPIRGQPLSADRLPDGVRLEVLHEGLRMTIEWRLPPGAAPLCCRLRMDNESAIEEPRQFECFFVWRIPPEEWARTALALPGHAPMALRPFGELWFESGNSGEGCAAWWLRGTAQGVALRARAGVCRYFAGRQNRMFALGPHSVGRLLARGDSIEATFEIAPLDWAQGQGWACDTAAAERALAAEERAAAATAGRLGGIAAWTASAAAPAIPRRAVHLTFQYEGARLRDAVALLEEAIAPAGFNQIVAEVGRAFPYRSVPGIAPDWAWTRADWREYVRAARALGLEPIPQFNSLGHQPESGLVKAVPELGEDPFGWCVCPRHPGTQRSLQGIFDELIDVFEPRACHIGLDEIDMHPAQRRPGGREVFGCCPRCRAADAGELFAEHILGLHEHLRARGMEVIMWSDMLMYREDHNSRAGLRMGTWQAIQRLPRDIVMTDWAYAPVKDYGGARYFMAEGFRTLGATWHDPRPIASFARFAAENGMHGMIQTTWAPPVFDDVPVVCVLLAGKCFRDPFGTDHNQALAEARALALSLGQKREQRESRT